MFFTVLFGASVCLCVRAGLVCLYSKELVSALWLCDLENREIIKEQKGLTYGHFIGRLDGADF